MFGALKKKFEEKRQSLSQETQQRIQEFAERQREEALAIAKREEEESRTIIADVDKYLSTTHLSFLLKPEISKAVLNMLYARSEGRKSPILQMTKEMRKAHMFYHKELSIFIRILEKKGVTLKGNEERFFTIFMNKLSENNFNACYDRYGDFIRKGASLEEAIAHYLEVVEEEFKFESGRLDFFAKYLIEKNIVSSSFNKSKLKKKIKAFEKSNEEEYKVKEMEKRLEQM
ncbi:hypothetical protein [Desertibacillus haloalkaliphilus]|uniref:hypothetical protein n=1 Tax=Desertibacillus haloalkaliphilus TaxID=1328930 RepID=UPI001C2783D7|nr:hypothetical protein [Desertibacillus haloalkaliphilus]MBU8907559.1 hypothetical protein [Desertibacillus haloalkaliphilus]